MYSILLHWSTQGASPLEGRRYVYVCATHQGIFSLTRNHACTCTCILYSTCTSSHSHKHTLTCTHTLSHTHSHAPTDTHMRTRAHTHTHSHTLSHTHTCTHTHSYTHTHTLKRWPRECYESKWYNSKCFHISQWNSYNTIVYIIY